MNEELLQKKNEDLENHEHSTKPMKKNSAEEELE
jgi:hypothetical protein